MHHRVNIIYIVSSSWQPQGRDRSGISHPGTPARRCSGLTPACASRCPAHLAGESRGDEVRATHRPSRVPRRGAAVRDALARLCAVRIGHGRIGAGTPAGVAPGIGMVAPGGFFARVVARAVCGEPGACLRLGGRIAPALGPRVLGILVAASVARHRRTRCGSPGVRRVGPGPGRDVGYGADPGLAWSRVDAATPSHPITFGPRSSCAGTRRAQPCLVSGCGPDA